VEQDDAVFTDISSKSKYTKRPPHDYSKSSKSTIEFDAGGTLEGILSLFFLVDKGLLLVYKLVLYGVRDISGGRSSMVEHQLPNSSLPNLLFICCLISGTYNR
jgi:hypothetical protein